MVGTHQKEKDATERTAERQVMDKRTAESSPRMDASQWVQRCLGNRYVQRRATSSGQTEKCTGDQGCSCAECAGRHIQTKLSVGAVDDPYEQEADRVARQVMRMPTPVAQRKASSRQNRTVQIVHRKESRSDATEASPNVERQIRSADGGQPLPEAARSFFEPRFGYDFTGVRVHTGILADQLNRELSALAFTNGQNIFFRRGEYDPESCAGRELLAHELTHVLQQGGALQRKPALDDLLGRTAFQRGSVRLPEDGIEEDERQTRVPGIQRDLAIEPPNPTADAALLTNAQVQEAIRYNTAKLGTADPAVLATLRDVLGISRAPTVIDEDFVNAVARWQASNNLKQDGKLGPNTAAPLFRELRAEGLPAEARALASLVRRGRVIAGPTYAPHGVVAAPAGAGRHVPFALTATFGHDPDNGIFSSCCEVRQEIQWDAAMTTSFAATGDPVPHGGFPAATPAGAFIEDRDAANAQRYGHRAGFGGGVAGNRYVNAAGNPDQANGVRFEGHDDPHMLAGDHGQMQFRISVVDVCNENQRIGGTDTITINW